MLTKTLFFNPIFFGLPYSMMPSKRAVTYHSTAFMPYETKSNFTNPPSTVNCTYIQYLRVSLKLKVVDLFCGCGGMSLGFENAGFDVVAAFDNWSPALDVYKKNFTHNAFEIDLGGVEAQKQVKRLAPMVIIGGPPCQDFSSAGNNNYSSKRANLLGSYTDIVLEANPRAFVLENVPRARLTQIFADAKDRFIKAGYGLTQVVIDASYCGVPQVRKRLFLIGCAGAEDGFLETAINQRQSSKQMTIRDYFGSQLDINHYFRVPTNYSRRGVFSVDAPSTTIRAVDRPIPKGYPGHPDDTVPISENVRALTIEERAKIQTFPDEYSFFWNKDKLEPNDR